MEEDTRQDAIRVIDYLDTILDMVEQHDTDSIVDIVNNMSEVDAKAVIYILAYILSNRE